MCWRKGIGIPADARCAACRPRLTAAQGPRVEQRAIVARTFQKSQSKAGAARRPLPPLFNFLRLGFEGQCILLAQRGVEPRMHQGKHGLQVFDEMARLLLEVGPHVISESPEFAQKIGVIAASWSQAEVNLNCLFAILLDTTPEDATKELKKHGSAAKATSRARIIAAETLKGAELDSLIEILNRLEDARLKRNRVQHDVWARKAGDNHRLFAVHANDYLDLAT